MLALIGMTAFLTMALLALSVGRALSAPRARLQARVNRLARDEAITTTDYHDRRLLRMQNYSTLPGLRELLQRSARAERVADDLERAGIPLRVGEYLMIRVGVGLVLALLVVATLPIHIATFGVMCIAFLVGMIVPRWFVVARIRGRQRQVENMLPDALDMIGRSLRAGSGLLTAMQSVIEQMDGPIVDELSRTRQEMAAGLGAEEAFRALDARLRSKDLHIVVTAILVQREVGGNLAEILDNVSYTMRERIRLRAEIRAMSARQRLSSYVIALIPIGVLVILTTLSPDIVRPLFTRDGGRMLLGIAGALEVTGFLVMYRLASASEV